MNKKTTTFFLTIGTFLFFALFPINVFAATIPLSNTTLSVGQSWTLGAGYVLTVNSIDARANPRQVWIVLQKNRVTLDDKILNQGDVYSYEKVFKTTIYSIFAGATSDLVQLRETTVGGEIATYCSVWNCDSWSFCVNDQYLSTTTQIRTCTNRCSTTANRPAESQSCLDRRTMTLSIGENASFSSDYTVQVNSIDARANPKQVWLVFSERGYNFAEEVLKIGDCFTARERSSSKQVRIKIDNIFSGTTSDKVQIADADASFSPSCRPSIPVVYIPTINLRQVSTTITTTINTPAPSSTSTPAPTPNTPTPTLETVDVTKPIVGALTVDSDFAGSRVFTIIATDNRDTNLACTLKVGGYPNGTFTKIADNTYKSSAASVAVGGTYIGVTCVDDTGNSVFKQELLNFRSSAVVTTSVVDKNVSQLQPVQTQIAIPTITQQTKVDDSILNSNTSNIPSVSNQKTTPEVSAPKSPTDNPINSVISTKPNPTTSPTTSVQLIKKNKNINNASNTQKEEIAKPNNINVSNNVNPTNPGGLLAGILRFIKNIFTGLFFGRD